MNIPLTRTMVKSSRSEWHLNIRFSCSPLNEATIRDCGFWNGRLIVSRSSILSESASFMSLNYHDFHCLTRQFLALDESARHGEVQYRLAAKLDQDHVGLLGERNELGKVQAPCWYMNDRRDNYRRGIAGEYP